MPTFDKTANQWRENVAITPKASSKLTTLASPYTGTAFDTSGYSTLDLLLDVTAITASPSLDVKLQTSDDGSNNWTDLSPTFTTATGTGSERKRITGLGKFCRVYATCSGGGADATFSVAGSAK